jgi:alpha,alpha-trehalase
MRASCEHHPSEVSGNYARHATGGSISGLLPRLSDQQLNVSQSINNTGNVRYSPFNASALCAQSLIVILQMFEKFSTRDIDSGGRGGEYTVQAGFGWTNGVVLWVASTFGKQLVVPVFPDPLASAGTSSPDDHGKNSALRLAVAQSPTFGLALLTVTLQLLVV